MTQQTEQDLDERNAEIVDRVANTDEPMRLIGEDYGISRERVRQIAKRHDVKRTTNPEQGDRSYRRGTHVVYRPDHPRSWESGWVPMKYIVAERKLGRPLRSGEVVVVREGLDRKPVPDDVEVRTTREHARMIGASSRSYEEPEDLLVALRWLALELGRTPRNVDVNELLPFSHGTYYSAFGSMTAAQELAGLVPNSQGGRDHAAEVSDAFREEYGYLSDYDSAEKAVVGEREARKG